MKNKLVKTLLCCSLLGGVGIVGAAVENNDLQAVRAEDGTVFNSTGKDMTNIRDWKAADGNFIEVDNWKNSGRGISFEFKVSETGSKGNAQVQLKSGDTQLTDNIYLFHNSGSGPTMTSDDVGLLKLIDSANGWYRYELMFSEIPAGKIKADGKLNRMHNTWGGTNFTDMIVRNMKVIKEHSRDVTAVDVSGKTNDISRWDNAFPYIANWGSSTKGIYIEYKPGKSNGRIPFALEVRSSTAGNVKINSNITNSAPDTKWYMNNCDGSGKLTAPTIGKEFDIGDGWRRYELMMPELVQNQYIVDGTTDGELYKLDFLWGNTGLDYRWQSVAMFGTIDRYSQNVIFNVGGVESGSLAANGMVTTPDQPETPSGKHFVGWATESADGDLFDFNTALAEDITLYAKFADHDFSEFVSKDATSHTYKCECGEQNTESHTFAETVTEAALKTAATCTEDAVYYKSCACGALSDDTFVDTGSAKGHNVNGAVKTNAVEATCEETGIKEYYKCPDCGVYFEDATLTTEIGDADALATWLAGDGVIDANGHDYGDLIAEVPATFDTDGVKAHYECADCGKKFIYEDNTYVEVTDDAQLKIDATGPALKEAAKDYLDNYVETNFPEADYTVYAADIADAVAEAKAAIDEATDEATIEAIKAAILEDAAKVKSDAELVEAFDDAVEALVDLEYQFSGQSFGLKQDSKTLYNAAIAAYNNLGDQAETLLAENTNYDKLLLLSTARQYVESSQSGLFGIFLQQTQLMGSQERFDELCGVLVEYANAMMAAEDMAALQAAYLEGWDAIEAVNIMLEDMIDELDYEYKKSHKPYDKWERHWDEA